MHVYHRYVADATARTRRSYADDATARARRSYVDDATARARRSYADDATERRVHAAHFMRSIILLTQLSSTVSGTEPHCSTTSWNSLTSNFSPACITNVVVVIDVVAVHNKPLSLRSDNLTICLKLTGCTILYVRFVLRRDTK